MISLMKSAYELAMSRLEKNSPATTLTEEQKKALAEIDSEIAARIAEQRIFLEGEMAKVSGDEHAVMDLRRQLASEIASLEEKRESKKSKVRSGS
jgi:hypothetical protein